MFRSLFVAAALALAFVAQAVPPGIDQVTTKRPVAICDNPGNCATTTDGGGGKRALDVNLVNPNGTVTTTATGAKVALDAALANVQRPTYVACSAAEANTAAAEAMVIEAGAAKATRIRSIWINPGLQTTAAYRALTVLRRTTASSSGSVIVPGLVDSADAAFSGVVRTKPTAGSAGATLYVYQAWVPTAVANNTIALWPPPNLPTGVVKDLVIPAGVANGIAVSDPGATGGASLMICAAFTEE